MTRIQIIYFIRAISQSLKRDWSEIGTVKQENTFCMSKWSTSQRGAYYSFYSFGHIFTVELRWIHDVINKGVLAKMTVQQMVMVYVWDLQEMRGGVQRTNDEQYD